MGFSTSGLALLWNGALTLAFSLVFLFKPNLLFSGFYADPSLDVSGIPMLVSICRYYGCAHFVLAFLFLHYIGMPDKHQAGLRTACMLCGLYLCVALYRLVFEASQGGEAAKRTLAIQGFTLLVSVVGLKAAPRPPKKDDRKDN